MLSGAGVAVGQDTKRRIGNVIPLRQHRRNPSFGSALARLVAGGAVARGARSPEGDRVALERWLAVVDEMALRQADALERDASGLRVARSALSETLSALREMRALASEGARSAAARDRHGKLSALALEVTRVAENADYVGQPLLAGRGALADASAEALGVDALDPEAPDAVERIDTALEAVDRLREELADRGRALEAEIAQTSVARENVAAAHASPGEVSGALANASALREQVVDDAGSAARTQAVRPGIVLRLVR